MPGRSIIPSLKLGNYLSVQAHKPCSISHKNAKNRLCYIPSAVVRVCASVPDQFIDVRLESYSTDRHTDRPLGKHNTSPRTCVGYEYYIKETHSSGVTKTCALSPNCPLLHKCFMSLNSRASVQLFYISL